MYLHTHSREDEINRPLIFRFYQFAPKTIVLRPVDGTLGLNLLFALTGPVAVMTKTFSLLSTIRVNSTKPLNSNTFKLDYCPTFMVHSLVPFLKSMVHTYALNKTKEIKSTSSRKRVQIDLDAEDASQPNPAEKIPLCPN